MSCSIGVTSFPQVQGEAWAPFPGSGEAQPPKASSSAQGNCAEGKARLFEVERRAAGGGSSGVFEGPADGAAALSEVAHGEPHGSSIVKNYRSCC